MANYNISILTAYHGETDRVIHINDIDKHTTGQKLGPSLVCMDCGAQVQARIERNNMYRKRAHSRHFAHVSSHKACIHQGETYLHRKAKDIIKDAMCMMVPPLAYATNLPRADRYYTDEDAMRLFYYHIYYQDVSVHFDIIHTVQRGAQMMFSDVVLEYHTDKHTFIPDCYATTTDGRKVYIEIYVTHAVDEEKRMMLSEKGISTIEIDLSDPMYRQIDQSDWVERIKQTIIEQMSQKKWLFHADASHAVTQLKQLYLSRIHTNNKVIIDLAHEEALTINSQYDNVNQHLNILHALTTDAQKSLNYETYLQIQSLLDAGVKDMTCVNTQLRNTYHSCRQTYKEQLMDIEYNIIQSCLIRIKNGDKSVWASYTTKQLQYFQNYTLNRFQPSSGKLDVNDSEHLYESLIIEIYKRKKPLCPSYISEDTPKQTIHKAEEHTPEMPVYNTTEALDPNVDAAYQRAMSRKQTSDVFKSYGVDSDLSW